MKEIPILFSTPMVQAILEGRKSQTRRLFKCNRLPAEDIASVHPDGAGKGWIAWAGRAVSAEETRIAYPGEQGFDCPYGKPGDVLWVRETWGVGSRPDPFQGSVEGIEFKADGKYIDGIESLPLHFYDDLGFGNYDKSGWRSSIHMPKAISRIWLQVTDIHVERLQDISEEDAKAEGVQPNCTGVENCPSQYCQRMGCQSTGEYYHYLRDLDDFPAFSAKESFESLWQSINGPESWEANPWVWVISFKALSTTGKPK